MERFYVYTPVAKGKKTPDKVERFIELLPFGEENAIGPISVEINAKDISYLFNDVRNVNYVSAINVEDATNAFDKCYDLKEVFMPDSHTIFRS